uniref:Signal recognition particle 54 kDa protein n=1 Tax=Leersia perrieri TaxID=77586 RepID=A0A0D9WIG0_9ORYZ
MVLAQLGGRITRALEQMSSLTEVDDDGKALTDCLNEIARALHQSGVPFKTICAMSSSIRRIVVNLDARTNDKRRIIHEAVFTELCNMLDSGKPSFTPTKGKPSVVLFVGLQGSGKTTSCTKYAYYHSRKGFKPSLVCADTSRAGAFDQLKQNARKLKIPYHGSYMESDPVKIAVEGVERLRKENSDLIIVDTSRRHKQEAALIEEKPDLVIFVIDGSIGQAAFDQAQAFKQSASVGAVIVTKLDGHAKGGGALSTAAATKSPVIFIGTGEHIDEFEVFDVKPFVSRLLGIGDLSGLVNKEIHDVMPTDQPTEFMQKLAEGTFTLRLLYKHSQNILNMGPIGQFFHGVPGFSSELMPKGYDKENRAKIKRYMTIMDSMTDEELDSTNPMLIMNESRISQIARRSGRLMKDVRDLLQEHKQTAKRWSKFNTNR